MSKRKKILWVTGILVFLGILAGPLISRLPFPQVSPVDGGNLVGVNAGGSFAWVIPTQNGVVLIDTGGDVTATALKEEIAGRKVLAILTTHGHVDHIAGLPLFPDAIVYVGPGEGPLVRGEASSGKFVPDMANRMMGKPYTPPKLMEFTDGDTIEIDGESFLAIHVYGHTMGSAIYIWNDLLFTGDSIVGRGGYVSEMPSLLSLDSDSIRANVAKVLAHPFDRIADGHIGLHTNIREQVMTYVGK